MFEHLLFYIQEPRSCLTEYLTGNSKHIIPSASFSDSLSYVAPAREPGSINPITYLSYYGFSDFFRWTSRILGSLLDEKAEILAWAPQADDTQLRLSCLVVECRSVRGI